MNLSNILDTSPNKCGMSGVAFISIRNPHDDTMVLATTNNFLFGGEFKLNFIKVDVKNSIYSCRILEATTAGNRVYLLCVSETDSSAAGIAVDLETDLFPERKLVGWSRTTYLPNIHFYLSSDDIDDIVQDDAKLQCIDYAAHKDMLRYYSIHQCVMPKEATSVQQQLVVFNETSSCHTKPTRAPRATHSLIGQDIINKFRQIDGRDVIFFVNPVVHKHEKWTWKQIDGIVEDIRQKDYLSVLLTASTTTSSEVAGLMGLKDIPNTIEIKDQVK